MFEVGAGAVVAVETRVFAASELILSENPLFFHAHNKALFEATFLTEATTHRVNFTIVRIGTFELLFLAKSITSKERL